jgi:hypothetical protein
VRGLRLALVAPRTRRVDLARGGALAGPPAGKGAGRSAIAVSCAGLSSPVTSAPFRLVTDDALDQMSTCNHASVLRNATNLSPRILSGKGSNPAMIVRGLQNRQPISPQRFAHRRVGADAANKLVIFAREYDGPRYRLVSTEECRCQARRASSVVVDGVLSDR